ncbi:MAG: DUF2061 domain-containing protein [Candidatus Thalassarchaeum sp.]|nr:DUF2061 domain-containing protein [Candidatus Thalassarchaeum sp.]
MNIRPAIRAASILQTEHTITEHIEGAGHSNKKRSLVKTLTWRFIASTDTVIIARVLTGSWTVGLSIASIEIVTKMILYYLHERGWSKWDWGLEDVDVDVAALAEHRAVH